ncbi:MAG: type II CRISPR RNA-guided endonuclease Cas9 [Ignavibacteria bacterium]|nr:type II CRISPR RNA-guided endonuclease Cas9 [Ignavibacteria bacterium]MBK6417597.1 type II CRISPR RNA-guided endonuclease Cas9 [Ignavibacteria bacterium]MBK7411102.1 type II CRISPR RNA-guided endonuclease Cas9 [Ignavibacteria bacterium]
MGKILGLDVGSNSLGWAIVNTDEDAITGMGSRIFTAGVDNLNGENEASRNAQRRLKRQMRRQYERSRQRRNQLRLFLIRNGLLPTESENFDVLLKRDPYHLRKKGLDERLELFEIGRCVDHINARRGFRSNRKASSDEEESGVLFKGSPDDDRPGIDAIMDSLHPELRRMKSYLKVKSRVLDGHPDYSKEFRTAGEYLAGLNPREVRRRKRFLLREHLEIELDLLLTKQSQFHNELTPESIETIMKLVFWQRPLKSVRKLVGNCRFEIGKKRCHKSHPEFQRFRLLQQVNNLEVYGPGRVLDDDRKLTAMERSALLTYLTEEKSIDTTKPRNVLYKLLGLSTKAEYRFNLERLDACSTVAKFTDVFGPDRVAMMSQGEMHSIWNVFNLAEDAEWLEEYAKKTWQLTHDQAVKASKLRLEESYGSLCLKAVRRILPHLENGMLYHEACGLAGYNHSQPDGEIVISDVVPALSSADIRNPIVQTSFAEMRKVVNLLIKRHGPFDSVRVELARELKKPKIERVKIEKRNKGFRDENEQIRQKLRLEFGVDSPKRADIERYKLWEEQNHRCIYTGNAISQDMLFNGPVDIDHIMPYSRTLDDSRNNKVLCLRSINLAKKNMSPSEACDAGVLNRNELRERVDALVRANKINKSKSVRFFMSTEDMQKLYGEDFLLRQLNDTRYIGRLTAKYLRYICEDVVVSNGMLTSALRRRWGLDAVLPDLAAVGRAWLDAEAHSAGTKSRADHRHHAIDALVVALTDRGLLSKVAQLNARGLGADLEKHYADGRIRLPEEPLPGLKAMATRCIDNVIVSHRVNRKRRGQLHEETIYGIAHDDHGVPLTNEKGIPLYVVRKPIESLTASMIMDVVDPVIKGILLERLTVLGIDVSTKFAVPKTAFMEPVYMTTLNGSRGPRIKRVRIYKAASNMVLLRDHGVYVEPGSNDRIILGVVVDGGGSRPRQVLSLLEATDASTKISVDRPFYTYRINELYCTSIPSPSESIEVCNVYKVQSVTSDAGGRIKFRHHAAAIDKLPGAEFRLAANKVTGQKMKVDEIGQVSW